MRERLMNIVCDSIATDRCLEHCTNPHCGLVQTVVQKLFANGITIPVRCKDCKYWGQDVSSYSGDDESFCTNPDGLDNYAHPDDFCSYGARKDDDGNG